MKVTVQAIIDPPMALGPVGGCTFYREIELPDGIQPVPGMMVMDGDGKWAAILDEIVVEVDTGAIRCWEESQPLRRTKDENLVDFLERYAKLLQRYLDEGWRMEPYFYRTVGHNMTRFRQQIAEGRVI
jgi:hypothetical protein